MSPWRRIESRRVQRCGIFDLDRVTFQPPDGSSPRPFYVIEAPDWINVIPLTEDRRVLMVRQFRFGIEAHTLEIPGGMCDPRETPYASVPFQTCSRWRSSSEPAIGASPRALRYRCT